MRLPTWISSPFRKTAVVLAAAVVVMLLLAASPVPRERLSPDGIEGTLLLCGAKPPDRALDLFCEEAGQEKASLAILIGDRPNRDAADKLAAALKARKPASVVVLDADTKAPKMLEALRGATGVWVLGGVDSAAGKELPAAMKRGIVAASGSATRDVSDLLPGAVIDPDFAGGGPEKLFAALDKSPGAFGVGLGEGAALRIRGREMNAVGDGAVTILLAKSSMKPRRVLEITEKAPSDYTMLCRAAIARAGAPFPPIEPRTPEIPKGALVIVGGGGMPTDVTKKFIDLAGGPDALIVVLPTASPGASGDEGGFFKAREPGTSSRCRP